MTKKKSTEKEIVEAKPYTINSAALSDGLCNYSFEITDGVGLGDTHTVKGKGLFEDDLSGAFRALNVHLAAIDDVFKHSDVDVSSIHKMRNHELTALYEVEGFKMKGSENNLSVILVGTKGISTSGDRMEIQTPKIPLDKLSSYEWWHELLKAINLCRTEVELYKEGKCTVPEESDLGSGQLTIADGMDDEDFESGRA